jgi:hypothetical protein
MFPHRLPTKLWLLIGDTMKNCSALWSVRLFPSHKLASAYSHGYGAVFGLFPQQDSLFLLVGVWKASGRHAGSLPSYVVEVRYRRRTTSFSSTLRLCPPFFSRL